MLTAILRICQVAVGTMFFCNVPYTGDTVVEQDGRFQTCSIKAGLVSGMAVVKREDGYYMCEISGGRLFRCNGSKFTGQFVLEIP